MRTILLFIAIFSLSFASAQQNEFINIKERVAKRIELLNNPSSEDIFPLRLGGRATTPSWFDDPYLGNWPRCTPILYRSIIKRPAYYVSVSDNGVEFMREKRSPGIMKELLLNLTTANLRISSIL